jgi:hypothetical protein
MDVNEFPEPPANIIPFIVVLFFAAKIIHREGYDDFFNYPLLLTNLILWMTFCFVISTRGKILLIVAFWLCDFSHWSKMKIKHIGNIRWSYIFL